MQTSSVMLPNMMKKGRITQERPTGSWVRLDTLVNRIAARLTSIHQGEISTLGREGAVNGSGNEAATRPTSIADERPGGVGEERTLNLKKGRTYSRQGGVDHGVNQRWGEIEIWETGPRRPRSAGLMLVWDAH